MIFVVMGFGQKRESRFVSVPQWGLWWVVGDQKVGSRPAPTCDLMVPDVARPVTVKR